MYTRRCAHTKQVRSLMRSTMDGVDKKLEAMAGRVHKHLGHGPLFSMVWGTLKTQLLARCVWWCGVGCGRVRV